MSQGTVLEPLLFLSYINDLPDVPSCVADYCLNFKCITSDRDQQALQSDILSLEQWEKDWQMEFNPGKCTAIRVMPKKTKLARKTSYVIHNKMLETSNTSRYIGVSITHNLTWSRHTSITAGKANRVLGFLWWNINVCSTKVKAISYTTMVRPIMEHVSATWDPHLQKDISRLETLQRRAARFCCGDYTNRTPGCVDDMLKVLHWESLETRRKNNCLSLLH